MKQFSFLVVMLIGLAFTAAAFSPDIGPPSTSITSQDAILNSFSADVTANVQAGFDLNYSEKEGGKVLSVGILQAEDYTVPLHYTSVALSNTIIEPRLSVDYNVLRPPSERTPNK